MSFTLLYVGEKGAMPAVNPPERDGWTWNKVNAPGNVVDKILDTARDCSADLIIMTTEGRDGFLDALRGSTTERVLFETSCPLLAVPG